jgi:hypothetical protein
MVIILGVSILLTYILSQTPIVKAVIKKAEIIKYEMEGLENKEDSSDDTEDDEEIEVDTDKITDDVQMSGIKDDLVEFEGIQNRIIEGLEKIEPLIKRAETFVEKFDKDAKHLEKFTKKKVSK